MALTPINYVVDVEDAIQTETTAQTVQTSKTWGIDLDNGRIGGLIDGEQAIRQYVLKALMTARNRYLIYDDQYGEELRDLIGHDVTPALINVEIPRLIREAIIGDSRIDSVTDIEITQYTADALLVEFTVNTVDGASIEFNEVVI